MTLNVNLNDNTANIQRKVSAVLALGNFPKLDFLDVILMMDTEENRRQMLCLAGSPKVRVVCSPAQACREVLILNTYSVFPHEAGILVNEPRNISLWNNSVVKSLCGHGLHKMQVHVRPIDESYYGTLVGYINCIGELPEGCTIRFFIPIKGAEVKALVYDGNPINIENKTDVPTSTTATALVAFRPVSTTPPPAPAPTDAVKPEGENDDANKRRLES